MILSNLTELDLRLKLLSGEGILIEGVGVVVPYTLREIAKYGYSKYLELLNLFIIEAEDVFGAELDIPEGLTMFDIYVGLGADDLHEGIEASLSFFLRSPIKVLRDSMLIRIGEGEQAHFITREHFEQVRNIIKIQNGLSNLAITEEVNPKDKRAQEILDKIKKAKEKVAKHKKTEEGEMDFADIVSAVATKAFGLNKITVWDLTIYQLYDEFKRLELIDNYDISIKSMLAGASNVQLKHWSSKID